MKAHLVRIAAIALFATHALSATAADDRPPSAEDLARLEARVAALEAEVAALEAKSVAAPSAEEGGAAMERVAQLADRAVARLVGMVRDLKRDLGK